MVYYKRLERGEYAVGMPDAATHECLMRGIANTVRLAMLAEQQLTEEDRNGIIELMQLMDGIIPTEEQLMKGIKEYEGD